jgi:hypothetical protein
VKTRKTFTRSGVRAVEKGLILKLPVVRHTSKETEDLIEQEALKI